MQVITSHRSYRRSLLAAAFCILTLAAKGQTWDGSPVLTTTPGPVGIGLTSPQARLHIMHQQMQDPGPEVSIYNTPALKIENTYWYSGLHPTSVFGVTPPNVVEVWNTLQSSAVGGPWGTPNSYFLIDAWGSVGINTATPSYRLDVNGDIHTSSNANVNSNLYLGNDGHVGGTVRMENDGEIYLRGNGDPNHGLGWYGIVGRDAKIWNGQTIDGPVLYGYQGGALATNQYGIYKTALRWNKNGQVMIGSKVPINSYSNFSLGVDGDIICRRVVVQITDWFDNVFDSQYKLRPIDDLRQYVAENKHLPEIPSESEVKDKGLNVGEVNGLLLKKVEELTLYIIQQQAEIDNLKKKIDK